VVHDYVELVFGGSREAEAERYLDSAVASLRQEHLSGWPLVERAQQAVHQQFWNYSYNTALQVLLHKLGIDSVLVHASRVRLADDPTWRMGHVWVQVTINGEVRDGCAGSASLNAQLNDQPEATTPVAAPPARHLTERPVLPRLVIFVSSGCGRGQPQASRPGHQLT
jgi:hypothetical protein